MKVALVTTPPSVASGIGDYTQSLAAELEARVELEQFVEHGRHGERVRGREQRSVEELDPRAFDRIVYQLGNEIAHAFMPAVLRRLGGTVVLHDWVLFDLALAAHPSLARGGPKGFALALREGGLEEARVFLENVLDKRRARREAAAPTAEHLPPGATLLDGWHGLEPEGRWTGDRAHVRLPGRGLARVRVECFTEPGRSVELRRRGGAAAATTRVSARASESTRELALELDLGGADDPIVAIDVAPVFVSDDQRRHGDTRRLGAFVRRIRVEDALGAREIALSDPPHAPIAELSLVRDRFRLPFNRSIVGAADSFLVHSRFLRERLREARGERIPAEVVHHGATPRWSDEDRHLARARLGLAPDWREGILITSFGHVQRHKRIDVLLAAFARARRERPDLRLALVGAEHRESFDARALASALGLEAFVRFTGRVREEDAWPWIHAGDFAVQLRGPSTGGTSGGVFQSLGLGRAVIASDLDEQKELPEGCVLRIPPGDGEVEGLAGRLLELAADPALRARMELAARAFVRDECAWPRVAERYVACLADFPAPRGRR